MSAATDTVRSMTGASIDEIDRRGMTLRLRLAIISAASLFAVFALLGVGVYAIFGHATNQALDDQLQRQARQLEVGQGVEPEETENTLETRVTQRELLARLLSPNLTPLAQSSQLLPVGTLPIAATTRAVANDGRPRISNVQVGATHLRLLERRVGGDVLQVAVDRDDADRGLRRLRGLLMLVACLATLASAALGYWVVGRALRPIQRLTRAARDIEATGDLARRVPQGEQVDEVGQLARTFNDMLAALDVLQQSQRRFIADASHELRTPLTSLAGNVEYLGRADLADTDRDAAFADVSSDVNRLTRQVDDLLMLARADAARAGRARERLRFDEIVRTLCDARGRRYPDHPLTFTGDPVWVRGDVQTLEGMVENLLDNARAYTPAGTAIDVTLHAEGDMARLEVADHGPGLGAGDAERIFERFYRGTTSLGTDGSGLGLAIVRQTAAAHGGRIEFAETPGGGCTFRIELPRDGTA